MIIWKHSFASTVLQFLHSQELAHVQCVATVMCERAFSVQNLIKTKV